MWEIAENLHRLDLTKEQRDEHIRRYIELVQTKREADQAIVVQNGQQLDRPVGRPKSVVTEVSEAIGLSRQTIERACNPKPNNVVMVREAETDEEAIIREANAIVSAWSCP